MSKIAADNNNVISHGIETSLGESRESLDRPGWTSEGSTGMLESYKFKHSIVRGIFRLRKWIARD